MNRNRSAHHSKWTSRQTTNQRQRNQLASVSKYSNNKTTQAQKISDLSLKVMVYVTKFQVVQGQIRIITRQLVRDGGSKVFYDAFSMFGRVLDDRMQASDLNPQIVTGILQFLRYPHSINKTIFQPIGAPHTWIHCLQILDFMGEVASYTSAFKAHCQTVESRQTLPQNDDVYIKRKAILENDEQILVRYLQEQTKELISKAQQFNQKSQKIEKDIIKMNQQQPPLIQIEESLKQTQKSLAQLQNDMNDKYLQQKKLEQYANKLSKDIQSAQTQNVHLDLQLEQLTYKLENNQLTAEETQKLHQEVKQSKIENHTLQAELGTTKSKIHDSIRKSIDTLKQYYKRFLICFNQYNSLKLDGKVLGQPIEFINVFDQLEDLCISYTNTNEIKEGNLKTEFQQILSKLNITSNANNCNRIHEEISQAVRSKQKQNQHLIQQLEKYDRQYQRLRQQHDVLLRIQNSSIHRLQDQDQKINYLKNKVEKVKAQCERIANENQELEDYCFNYEAETTKIMTEIQQITEDTKIFNKHMKEEMKDLEETARKVKRSTFNELQKLKQRLFEACDKSEQKQPADEILQELGIQIEKIQDSDT